MAGKKWKVHGIEVEMWETSFRVDGMSSVIHIGKHTTKEHVDQLVSCLFCAIREKAVTAGKIKLADKARAFVMNALDTNAT